MEQRIAIGVGEIRYLEIECADCHCFTALAVDKPKWTYLGQPAGVLGERGQAMCAWCGRSWPDRSETRLSSLRDVLLALKGEGPPVKLVIGN